LTCDACIDVGTSLDRAFAGGQVTLLQDGVKELLRDGRKRGR
jgi:hypothetical protein